MPDQPTPMMQQYLEAKRLHPEAVVLFRMGDFYETFYDDAETCARVLGLTLTSRDKGENPVPMAGFPHHALEGYLAKLIAAGHRVAVCDQVEDPRFAKGLVKREVTRVVTPGTLTDEALLDPRRSNYLAAVCPNGARAGLAWVELSTGDFVAADLAAGELAEELGRLEPAECLLPQDGETRGRGDAGARGQPHMSAPVSASPPLPLAASGTLTRRPPWVFQPSQARETLERHFRTATLEGFDLPDSPAAIGAAGALIDYLAETQKGRLEHIRRIETYRRGSTLILDDWTRRSLELTRTLRDGRREGSLLGVLDETATPMGARLLADWLANPSTDRATIEARHEAVAEFVADKLLCRDLRELLHGTYDLQRLNTRIETGRATPRDLRFLARTLAVLPKLKAKLTGRQSALLDQLESEIDLCAEIRAEIEAALVEEPPLQSREGGIIRDSYHAELDELRELTRGGKRWIAEYQAREIQRTGIANLKVGFNKVFGYYLEVTNVHRTKIPSDYQRKQTLKNAERYITPELKEHEDRVLRAEERAIDLEYELFCKLRDRAAAEGRRIAGTARAMAAIDVLAGFAAVAAARRYCRPTIVDQPILVIREGRHPVLDYLKPQGQFVPNDTVLGTCARGDAETQRAEAEKTRRQGEGQTRSGAEEAHLGSDDSVVPASPRPRVPASPHRQVSASRWPFLHLVTGPNMAGKSTYIRQAALITIMAQAGSFVPAIEAVIGIADRVFARVGASDELSRDLSTFMVEMTETARILNAATPRSLVILDEIGRGTSTYDGLAIAWAVVEYLHAHVGCRTLFATHYHELTQLADVLPGVANKNVAVREWGDEVIFLHQIVDGPADKSYGVHVARLAGVPGEVVDRAAEILATLEEGGARGQGAAAREQQSGQGAADGAEDAPLAVCPPTAARRPRQLELFAEADHPIIEELRRIDVAGLSGQEALEQIRRWREQL